MKSFIAIAFVAVLGFMTLSVRAEDKAATDEKPAASQPAAGESKTLEASDTDGLKGEEGKTVSVHGTISRVGKSSSGSILFINFQGVDRSGFSAIVRKADMDAVKDFGEDASDLQGKEVTITGPIKIYKDRPEIEIKKADQIKVTGGEEKKDKDQDKKDEKKDDQKTDEKKA